MRSTPGDVRTEYSATCGYTSVARDMSVSCKQHGMTVNQGGTADNVYSSLTDNVSVGDFCFSEELCYC